MDMTLLKEGAVIMIMGMGTVFLFLVIMIATTHLNEKVLAFVNKYFPEEIPEVKTTKKKVDTKDDEVAVAIACALRQRGNA